MTTEYIPRDAGTPYCWSCGEPLLMAVEAGYEHNEWAAYCPTHGFVFPAHARIQPKEVDRG